MLVAFGAGRHVTTTSAWRSFESSTWHSSSVSWADGMNESAWLEKGLAAGMWVEGLPLIGFMEGFSLREAKQNLAAGLSGHQHWSYQLWFVCCQVVEEQSVPKLTTHGLFLKRTDILYGCYQGFGCALTTNSSTIRTTSRSGWWNSCRVLSLKMVSRAACCWCGVFSWIVTLLVVKTRIKQDRDEKHVCDKYTSSSLFTAVHFYHHAEQATPLIYSRSVCCSTHQSWSSALLPSHVIWPITGINTETKRNISHLSWTSSTCFPQKPTSAGDQGYLWLQSLHHN